MTTRVFIFIFVYTVTVPSKYRRDIIVECVCKHVYVKLVRVYCCSKVFRSRRFVVVRAIVEGEKSFLWERNVVRVCVYVCVCRKEGKGNRRKVRRL